MTTHFVDESMPHWQAVLSSILENARENDIVVMGSEAGVELALAQLSSRADHKHLEVMTWAVYEQIKGQP